MTPIWLSTLAYLSIGLGIGSAIYLLWDTQRHPQHMTIMNWVWPLCALFGQLLIVWFYLKYGKASHQPMHHQHAHQTKPSKVQVSKGALHCGSGCTLGDIIAETLAFLFPTLSIWLGWQTLFAHKIFSIWILDFILAFTIGIIFQYFAIKPMKNIGFKQALWQALKADFLSLTAWQIGMYGFMAWVHFYWFTDVFDISLAINSAVFWFMMQLAMLCGFMTAYPINYVLIYLGIKEAM